MALVKGAGVGMVLGRSAGNSTPFGAAFAANFSTRPPQKDFFVFSRLLARLHKSKVNIFWLRSIRYEKFYVKKRSMYNPINHFISRQSCLQIQFC